MSDLGCDRWSTRTGRPNPSRDNGGSDPSPTGSWAQSIRYRSHDNLSDRLTTAVAAWVCLGMLPSGRAARGRAALNRSGPGASRGSRCARLVPASAARWAGDVREQLDHRHWCRARITLVACILEGVCDALVGTEPRCAGADRTVRSSRCRQVRAHQRVSLWRPEARTASRGCAGRVSRVASRSRPRAHAASVG
jgi:hypothetical protein